MPEGKDNTIPPIAIRISQSNGIVDCGGRGAASGRAEVFEYGVGLKGCPIDSRVYCCALFILYSEAYLVSIVALLRHQNVSLHIVFDPD